MIQEYLFVNNTDTDKEFIGKYKTDKVNIEIVEIEGSNCWIAIFEIMGENLTSAKILSQLNDDIIKKYYPIVLTNESSAYFNRALFPYMNELERKLRKLLYLKSALTPSDKGTDNIKDLESKDLGEIFAMLFSDPKFVQETKSAINNKSWLFTKNEVLRAIEDIEERTLWANLMGSTAVDGLIKNHVSIRSYRNDVMHAHNISYKVYIKARNLIKRVNKQLDTEIGKIVLKPKSKTLSPQDKSYNVTLGNAIKVLENYMELQAQFAKILSIYDTPGAVKTISDLQHYLEKLQLPSPSTVQALTNASREYARISKELASVSPLDESVQTIGDAIREQLQ